MISFRGYFFLTGAKIKKKCLLPFVAVGSGFELIANTVLSFAKRNSQFVIGTPFPSSLLRQLKSFFSCRFVVNRPSSAISLLLFYFKMRKIEIFLSPSKREDNGVPWINFRSIGLLISNFQLHLFQSS